jgi:hypothetical protein
MGLFLSSDEASYVNGQAIPVDGGLTASMPYAGKRFRFLLVLAGLDPAIHLRAKDSAEDRWIHGSSPRMTSL